MDGIGTNGTTQESKSRYAMFSLDEDDIVIFDRENPDAWIRVLSPATVRT